MDKIIYTLLGSSAIWGSILYFLTRKKSESIEKSNTKAKQIIFDSEKKAFEISKSAEKKAAKMKQDALESKKQIEIENEKIKVKEQNLLQKEKDINIKKSKLEEKEQNVEKSLNDKLKELEKVANLTKEEAKQIILEQTEKDIADKIGLKIKQSEIKIKKEVDSKARDLILDSMQQANVDYVAEYTISKIDIGSPENKGKIIGKEGRNIRAFEEITGVTVDLEEGESEVRLSCFNSIRREVARVALQRLLKDGRIHPARIEEVVKKTEEDIEKVMYKAGEELCHKVGIFNLDPKIMAMLGRYKYRFSYGQNMLQHTLEETQIGVKIAQEIGANINITKLACLLHDIGKVISDKEGSHIELGADYLKKMGMSKEVITAVEEHHDDNPSTVEGTIVQIADSMSGSRPGARYGDFEEFIKRMKELEETVNAFKGVEKAYAISAGREVRVMVNPDNINDLKAKKLAYDIAKKIQEEHTYAGTVKVTLIRETRYIEHAK